MTAAPSVPWVSLAIIGMGRMGQAVDALASSRGCEVVARIDRRAAEQLAASASSDARADQWRTLLQGAQVAVEVSTPDAARENVLGCLAAECPVVVGTTGWERHMGGTHDGERRDDALAAALARGGRVLIDANFSVGVHLFLAAARDVARRFAAHADFSPHIVETHHAAKRDAPSGTARALASHVEAGGLHGVGTTSVRVGAVPGTHELLLDGPFEQIVLRHEARDRRLFADGALTAARWLAAATAPGRYTMRDVLRSFAPDAS